MNTWLNTKLTEWNGFDIWQKTANGTAIGLFFALFIYGSYQYWAFNLTLVEITPAILLVFLAIYTVIIALLGSIGVWICGYIGIIIATLFSSFRWFYRKICP